MIPPFDKLRKFIKLEIGRKYDNRAVFGGLHLFANTWLTEAQAHAVDNVHLTKIHAILVGYGDMSPAERANAADSLLELLGDVPADNHNENSVHFANKMIVESEPKPVIKEVAEKVKIAPSPAPPISRSSEAITRQITAGRYFTRNSCANHCH